MQLVSDVQQQQCVIAAHAQHTASAVTLSGRSACQRKVCLTWDSWCRAPQQCADPREMSCSDTAVTPLTALAAKDPNEHKYGPTAVAARTQQQQ